MESANLHHQHQLPDQLAAGSASSLATPSPSFYGFGSNNHVWTSTTTFSIGDSNPNYNGVVSNLRDSRHKSDNNLVSDPLNNSTTSSMVQDLGFHWNSNASGSFYNQSAHELAKIKEEQSFPKFTEMLNTSPSHNMDGDYYFRPTSHHVKNEHKGLNELSEELLQKTLSSCCEINGHQISTGEFLSNNSALRGTSHVQGLMPGRGQFSQIYPSIVISNLNQCSSSATVSSSLDMSLRALDHLATTTAAFSGNLNQPLNDNLGISSFALDHQMQQSHRLPSCAHRKISSFNNEVTEAKRPGNLMEPKASQAHASKKTRLESRTSCQPFKVRKEKLGDRIAALQQLVAPFGKTDTASVLMEAIGYIKFLQNQVETLSVPYMKSSSSKSYKTMQGVGMKVDDGNEEPKRDLRRRGLCLVPLTCMSYVTGDASGGSVWPAPNFGGET
ncbi:hypothetical protein FNV43_RR11534 [Rhamnella rubrinervis]|uniref:BHLH domain-containing protein n=1 Tax=Rhamnella rubrinervis TaxID=2594499 RepID=A0A8K0H6G9_9ROSA|nr:hypothetical protein FNV43_RR11534 [Rhamnella rubrinervis]